jgi:hypothetical protein
MSLKIEYAINIAATPDVIWQVFNEIERWPRWDPSALQSARWVSGEPWQQGSKFEIKTLKPMALTLTPEIVEVTAPVFVHVKGSGGGVTGEQFYIFKWDDVSRTTEMRTLQEFSGMAISFFGGQAKGPILQGIEHMFRQVKQEAEEIMLGVGPNAPTY